MVSDMRPLISDMIESTESVISEAIRDLNSWESGNNPTLDVLVRSKLLNDRALPKYVDNPAVIQSIINTAQLNILKDPLRGYDLIQSMIYGVVQYNPTLLESIRYSNGELGNIIGGWNTDLREDLVRECLNQLMEMGDTEYVVNRVLLGQENSVKDILTTGALWLALKGPITGDTEELHYSCERPDNIPVSLLASRSEYFFYPGAKEDLIEVYDKALSKAVNMICSEDVSLLCDLRTAIMYYIYQDVTAVFNDYGDVNNMLGIDQVTADLAEKISYRVSDAVVQCIWDNLEFLINSSRGTGNATEKMLERILILYIECAMM